MSEFPHLMLYNFKIFLMEPKTIKIGSKESGSRFKPE